MTALGTRLDRLDPDDQPPALPAHVDANPVLSRWVRVRPDDVIEVQIGKVELGQGIVTALSQVAADGLAVRPDQVRMVAASTDGPDQGLTSGSMSTTHTRPALDLVCGNVRALFIEAAARRWGVSPDEVEIEDGVFRRGPDGGAGAQADLTYGALSPDVDLDVKADATLSVAPTRTRSVGLSVPRIDLRDKVTGRPAFIHDLRLPGMMFGRVVRPPSPGAHLAAVDLTVIDGLGARAVRDGSFLGVVSPSED
jgi:CO/xanthine dehydrogenase Mo-binding subunit